MSYVQHILPQNTPQTEPVSSKQEKNSAGGYSFVLDKFKRLERFLILGCDTGTYYASARDLTKQNATCIQDALKEDAARTINLITDISINNRAPKNDPAIFALAVASAYAPAAGRALQALPHVCRTATHLFQFVEAADGLRGWGSGLCKAISDWYLTKSPTQLAMQVTKYQQRNKWSHRDVLRKAHPKTEDPQLNSILRYITQYETWKQEEHPVNQILEGVEMAKRAINDEQIVELIHNFRLVREHIPTQFLNSVKVWDALLTEMPATAMLRNLGKMSSIGLMTPLSDASRLVTRRLRDSDFLRKGMLHPWSILLALDTYGNGRGFKGSLSWSPDPQVVAALDDAFYLSFGVLEPTNKRFMLGIDVSSSMSWSTISQSNISAAKAAACMAMVAYRTEPEAYAFGFATEFRDLGITPNDSLSQVLRKTERINFGGTDCAVPMIYAAKNKIKADAFCVYTDNETWAGKTHPHIALEQYRQKMGIDAKLVVFGLTATEFSIANPDDPGMLDVCGMDGSVPKVISEFVKG